MKSEVPPTPVANGSAAGSSTATGGSPRQSRLPRSPLATSTVMPATAASWSEAFVAASRAGGSRRSHWPHEMLTTCTFVDGWSATIWLITEAIDAIGDAV